MKTINDFANRIICGDYLKVMAEMPEKNIDLIVTDPPYLVRYRARDGRGFSNDETDQWLKPAFVQSFRVLKDNSYCVSFFGWHKVDRFLTTWRAAGFRTLERLVWIKNYRLQSERLGAVMKAPIFWPKESRLGPKYYFRVSSSGAIAATNYTRPKNQLCPFCP